LKILLLNFVELLESTFSVFRLYIFNFVVGKLRYPPKKSRKEQEADERIHQEKLRQKKDVKVPGIIDAEYLLSGQWHRDKQAQIAKKEKEKAMRKKLELLKWEGFPDESGYVVCFFKHCVRQN